jgi:polysaccharide biosynthesis protein PslH
VRILIITPYLPWPIDSGGNAAQFSTLAALQGHHLFDIVCPIKHAGLLGKVEELQRQLPHVRVRAAVLGPTPPSSKLRQRISEDFDKLESRFGWPARAFRGAARTFKHFCARALRRRLFGPSAAPSALSANAPVNVFETLPAPLLFEIAQALRDCPDLIQLEFADTLSLASWLPDHIPRVFVHHQIHWVYSERFLNSYGDNPYGRYIKNLMELQEVALLERVDAIVTFSEIDASCLRDRLDSVPVYVSPFPVPSDVSFRRDAGEPFNQKFIFLGSPAHLPNRQGAEWLLTEIWPQIAARCSDSRLQLIGQWALAELMDGKLLLVTNATDLTAPEVVERYKALADIERGFRVLKSEIEIGPVYHRLPERIRAHAQICFMALILHRVMRASACTRPIPACRRSARWSN